jgi:hypothetical protein
MLDVSVGAQTRTISAADSPDLARAAVPFARRAGTPVLHRKASRAFTFTAGYVFAARTQYPIKVNIRRPR